MDSSLNEVEVIIKPTWSSIAGSTLCNPFCLNKAEIEKHVEEHIGNYFDKNIDIHICLICGELCSSDPFEVNGTTTAGSLKDKLSTVLALDESYLLTSVDQVTICTRCGDCNIRPLLETFALFAKFRDKLIQLSSEVCQSILASHCKLRKEPQSVGNDHGNWNFEDFNLRRIHSMLTSGISLKANPESDAGLGYTSTITDNQFEIELELCEIETEETSKVQEYEELSIHLKETGEIEDAEHSSGRSEFEKMDINVGHIGLGQNVDNLDIKADTMLPPSNSKVNQLNRSYDCIVCDKTFRSNRSLKCHQKNHVPGDKSININKIYNCSQCTDKFSEESKLRVHQKQHKAEKNFCSICEKEFSPGALIQHLLSHQNKDVQFTGVYCNVCSKKFESPLLLAYHMEVHKGHFSCTNSSCKKGFKSTDELKRHESIHQTRTDFEILNCDFCSQVFDIGEKIKYEQHVLTHNLSCTKRFLCESCGKYFPTKLTLNRHFRTVHKNIEFKCKVCDKIFTSKSNLNCHQLLHTGNAPFQCQECKLPFFQKVSLDNHMKKHTGAMPYRCNHCENSGFSYKKGFRQHMFKSHPEIYSKSKRFTCIICYKHFMDETQLEEHCICHENLKCQICSKQFKMKTHLNEHLLRHADVRPYECKHCSKGFIRQKQLSNHMGKVHPHENSSTAFSDITCVIEVQVE